MATGRQTGQLSSLVGLVLLRVAGSALLGLALGSRALPRAEVLAAFAGRDVGAASSTVLDQRLPRTLRGLVIGAALGVGGAVAQLLACDLWPTRGCSASRRERRSASCSAPSCSALAGP